MTDNWSKRVVDILKLPTLLAAAVVTSTGAATPETPSNALRSDPVDPDVTLPPIALPSAPRPTVKELCGMTLRVQAALMRLGYFNGDIDGLLGPETRAALTAYQTARGLKETGRMDLETLTKLGISIP